jgi:hypothetical protein
MHHYHLGSAGFFWIANQFWFLAIALAYLAAYWLAIAETSGVQTSRIQTSGEDDVRFALATPAPDMREAGHRRDLAHHNEDDAKMTRTMTPR